MDKFKEIKATFEVVGGYPKDLQDDTEWKSIFLITRHLSGAFAYGDRSSHSLSIFNEGEAIDEKKCDYYYDTRYDHIPTNKTEWVKEWTEYIKSNWCKVKYVKLLTYEENERQI